MTMDPNEQAVERVDWTDPNVGYLIDLLRREASHSGVWFCDNLHTAARLLEVARAALTPAAVSPSAQGGAGERQPLSSFSISGQCNCNDCLIVRRTDAERRAARVPTPTITEDQRERDISPQAIRAALGDFDWTRMDDLQRAVVVRLVRKALAAIVGERG